MDDLEYLRRQAPSTHKPSQDARVHARAALLAKIDTAATTSDTVRKRKPNRFRARWIASLAAGVVVVAAAVTLALTLGSDGKGTASAAAATLRQAAAVAGAQLVLAPSLGQYLYVKSEGANLSMDESGGGTIALVPWSREIWIGENGRLRQSSGEPQFLSEADREHWVAAGKSMAAGAPRTEDLDPIGPPDLPTDPDELFARLSQEAGPQEAKQAATGDGPGLYEEMFVLVGDNLRETLASPALRAALYEVAARIPGVTLAGTMTDRDGRTGIGVSMDSDTRHTRTMLIIDPNTSQLLGEEEVSLEGNELGYKLGTVLGYSTYLLVALVPANDALPEASN